MDHALRCTLSRHRRGHRQAITLRERGRAKLTHVNRRRLTQGLEIKAGKPLI
jgi:hypothetical protein